jgi:HlyD family secretion protein
MRIKVEKGIQTLSDHRNDDTGHFLQPSSSPAGQAPLFVVVRTDKVRVFLDVPEVDATLVRYGERDGSRARIRVMALNEREFGGCVTGSSWMLEPSQRTLRTEIDFDNPNGVLRPGMYAHALIDVEQADAWTLPSETILTRDGLTFCYFLENGKAVRTNLKAGIRLGGTTEVLKKQSHPAKAGEKPEWIDFTGRELAITGKVAELTDGQDVRSNRE